MRYEELTYPRYETPLAEAYGGRFESVYIALHPFIRVPPGLSWQVTSQYPSDEQILSAGQKCRWAQIAALAGIRSTARLNQALLTSIGAISDHLCDFAARDALQQVLQSEPVWMPTEGRFEPLLQSDFLGLFIAAGLNELVFVPDFPAVDPVARLSVPKLLIGETPFPARGTLAAIDASFLVTVDWDSFFTLLYGPRQFLQEMAAAQHLEGFFALPTTEHFWFNYSMGCATVTLSPDDWTTAF